MEMSSKIEWTLKLRNDEVVRLTGELAEVIRVYDVATGSNKEDVSTTRQFFEVLTGRDF